MLRDLTVAENLRSAATSSTTGERSCRSGQAAYATFPILPERREQKAGSSRGGQQQMLAIPALMSEPTLACSSTKLRSGSRPS